MMDVALKPIRAIYYRSQLLRHSPIGAKLQQMVQAWEERKGKGDAPKGKAAWEQQFESGAWEYMEKEFVRYAVVVGFIERFKGGGEILDVGCGQGFLYRQFRPYGYERYVGIDLSETAVRRLDEFTDERTSFTQGNGDTYEPVGAYDLIVFNESLYYLRDPIASLRRYATHLKPGGAIIVSNYVQSRRARAMLSDAKAAFQVIDEAVTSQGGMSWRCVVLRP